jgi:hypothetical protein
MWKERLYMFINGEWKNFKKSDLYNSLTAKEKMGFESQKEAALGYILFYIGWKPAQRFTGM